TQHNGWLIALGLCAGQAMGVKYTGVGLALAIGVYVAWRAPRRVVMNGLILGVTTLLALSPWLIKGTLLYRNPVYPFAFGGVNWDVHHAEMFGGGDGLIDNGAIWQVPLLPWAATIFGQEGNGSYGFTLGLWLAAAPLLLILGWSWLPKQARQLARD